MRFRVPSLFLSLYLGYNNLDNLYMRYIHHIFVVLFVCFSLPYRPKKWDWCSVGVEPRALRTSVSSVHWRRTTFPSTISRVRPWEPSSARSTAMGYSPDDMEKLIKSEDFKHGIPEGYRKIHLLFKRNPPTPEFINIRVSLKNPCIR